MPLLLHGVERAEAQPDDTPLLVKRLVHSPNDNWVWLGCLQQGVEGGSVLPWRFGQPVLLALTEEVDLGVDVLLASCDLGLGQRGIVCFLSDS